MIPKFRAWHKELKIMRPVNSLCHLHIEEHALAEVHVPQFIDKSGMYYVDKLFWKMKDIELMQSTGIKDKDDKDIYEGDVVCYDFGGGVDTLLIERSPNDNQIMATYMYFTGEREALADAPCECSLIIGNIYENPELLKEMK